MKDIKEELKEIKENQQEIKKYLKELLGLSGIASAKMIDSGKILD
jgi:hypothetical protein